MYRTEQIQRLYQNVRIFFSYGTVRYRTTSLPPITTCTSNFFPLITDVMQFENLKI